MPKNLNQVRLQHAKFTWDECLRIDKHRNWHIYKIIKYQSSKIKSIQNTPNVDM